MEIQGPSSFKDCLSRDKNNSMIKMFGLIILFAVFSCAGGGGQKRKDGFEVRKLDQYYQSSGIMKYFLTQLPDWANFSTSGRCKRSTRVRYMHLKNLRKSFYLSYEQAIQFQYMHNMEYQKLKLNSGSELLMLKDEEKLFYNVSDKIQANIMAFRKPKFKRVHVLWIDPFLNNPSGLSVFMKRKIMDKGHPVFISMCLGFHGMNELLNKLKLAGQNIRLIPAGMFSIFTADGGSDFHFSIKLDDFFEKGQSLLLFVPKGEVPKEIQGNFKIQHY